MREQIDLLRCWLTLSRHGWLISLASDVDCCHHKVDRLICRTLAMQQSYGFLASSCKGWCPSLELLLRGFDRSPLALIAHFDQKRLLLGGTCSPLVYTKHGVASSNIKIYDLTLSAQMAPQASWLQDVQADSLESGCLEIQESGNLGVWDPKNKKWKCSEWNYILPKVFARSSLVGKNFLAHLVFCLANFVMGQTIKFWLFFCLFSLVVYEDPIYPFWGHLSYLWWGW